MADYGDRKIKDAQMRASINQKLVETGEKERLKELLRNKLIESGWRDELKAHCKEVVRRKGLEHVTVDDLVAEITPKGRGKEAFREREKCFLTWQNAQTTLQKKRETEAKLKINGKPEKLQQIQDEIKDWEAKEVKGQEEFEIISKTLRREISRFENNRVRDFRTVVIKYLESLMNHQQQLIQYWEAFLPEATAIA